jgi:hypothetical protein
MTNGRLFQQIHPVHVGTSGFITNCEDLFNSDPASDIVSLANYESCLFLIMTGTNASVGSATITVESCDDAAGSTTTAIAYHYWACTTADTWGNMVAEDSAGFTTSATSNNMYAIEVNRSELSGTDKFVRLKCTEVGTDAVDGMFTCILGNPRYKQEVKPTALA